MKLFTVSQVAEILQTNVSTVYKLQREIGFVTLGKKILRCPEKTLKQYISGHKSVPVGKLNVLSLRIVKEIECPSPKTSKPVYGKSTSKSQAMHELDSLLQQQAVKKPRSCMTS